MLKYKLKKLGTSDCVIGGCPTLYELAEECVYGACPRVFEDRENKEVFIVVGKAMNPGDFDGLEGKVGEGETIVAIPKNLIEKLRNMKF
ncbi:MAG TPA: hypothetical protein VJB94_03640 [Candidatus Nanoarchaeia archaeon]|nr:hypothetical protein [Candidatus Nanoarchaeia archaeon]